MITELLADIRQKLTHQRADIDDIAKKTGVSRRTLYYVIEGKSLTVGTIERLSKYFERSNGKSASGPIGPTNHNSKRNRERRAIARDRSLAESTGRSK